MSDPKLRPEPLKPEDENGEIIIRVNGGKLQASMDLKKLNFTTVIAVASLVSKIQESILSEVNQAINPDCETQRRVEPETPATQKE